VPVTRTDYLAFLIIWVVLPELLSSLSPAWSFLTFVSRSFLWLSRSSIYSEELDSRALFWMSISWYYFSTSEFLCVWTLSLILRSLTCLLSLLISSEFSSWNLVSISISNSSSLYSNSSFISLIYFSCSSSFSYKIFLSLCISFSDSFNLFLISVSCDSVSAFLYSKFYLI
jgi:hypothetical protein